MRYWKVTLPLLLTALIVGVGAARSLLWPMPVVTNGQTENAGRGKPEKSLPLVGTASCSARGCHGSIEPAVDPDRCGQNEYTRWTHDRHADAYRVLFAARSRNIVKHLGGKAQAHEDPRCLACHVTPLLASLPQDSAFVQEEKLFGVGCESCHGSATEWLAPHTARDWQQKKAARAMPDLADPMVHAKACVGCHVGAAPDKNIPVRDVNHDLIAAGHPRLNFEFGSYQANMPAHWRPKKKSEGPALGGRPGRLGEGGPGSCRPSVPTRRPLAGVRGIRLLRVPSWVGRAELAADRATRKTRPGDVAVGLLVLRPDARGDLLPANCRPSTR